MNILIPEAEFERRKRDQLLDYQAYRTRAEDLIRRIPNAAKKLGDPEWLSGRGQDEGALLRLTHARTQYALDLLSLGYSAGHDIDALRAFFPALLGYVEEYARHSEAFNQTDEGLRTQGPHIAIQDVEFTDANRLLCFAILLGWQETIPRIMAIIDYNNPLRDGMLERLASVYMARPAQLRANARATFRTKEPSSFSTHPQRSGPNACANISKAGTRPVAANPIMNSTRETGSWVIGPGKQPPSRSL